MSRDYDAWKTSPPEDNYDLGTVECPDCGGEGIGEDEDGRWSCLTCDGLGWLEEEDACAG